MPLSLTTHFLYFLSSFLCVLVEQEKAADKEDDDSKGGKPMYCGMPLIQLIKQLLKNNASWIQMRLLAINSGEKCEQPVKTPPREPSPSINLLLKFQRLLIVQIYPLYAQGMTNE